MIRNLLTASQIDAIEYLKAGGTAYQVGQPWTLGDEKIAHAILRGWETTLDLYKDTGLEYVRIEVEAKVLFRRLKDGGYAPMGETVQVRRIPLGLVNAETAEWIRERVQAYFRRDTGLDAFGRVEE